MKDIYISPYAATPVAKFLENTGHTLHLTTDCFAGESPVSQQISTHSDIYMCQLGLWESSHIFMGNTKSLGKKYPDDIIYNAVCTGKFFIHNLKFTDIHLLNAVQERYGKDICYVNVKQGYTRCSCLPVNETAFITSDQGISSALRNHGADVLLIESGHISLPGFDYGFIGGCGGNIIISGRHTVIINGDITSHPDYKNIADFLKAHDIDLVFFKDYPLEDIGSILLNYK